MDPARSFARLVKQHRKALDLTQRQLAGQVGCATITIQRIEQGSLRPSLQIVQRLADIFALPADERVAFQQLGRNDKPIAPATGRLAYVPLTAPLTPLIGRAREVAHVCVRLKDPPVRLLTLTGPGGVGKTRLALQAAADLEPAFADGAVFVDLVAVSDYTLVDTAIAQALGVRNTGTQELTATLVQALRGRQLLLVLDNFEHVLAAAPLIATLLQAAPRVKALLTSRVVAGVYGEHLIEVPTLAYPDPARLPPYDQLHGYEAIRLFVERARAAYDGFVLDEQNAPAVAGICAQLDGLPLAIELAAARITVLSPPDLLQRLEQSLALLTGGSRDLPARQQTIRATIDWSYDLLGAPEQLLFRRLGVFVGGFTLAAAEAVCRSGSGTLGAIGDLPGTVLDGVASLVDKSLVRHSTGQAGEPRFTMLETVREYAQEQLAASREAAALRRQHAAYYVALGETAAPELRGPNQASWLRRLDREHHNVRAVLEWSITAPAADGHAADLGLRLAVAVWEFWSRRDYFSEGRRWLAATLARTAGDPADDVACRLRAQALAVAGNLAVYQGDLAAGQTLLEDSLAWFEARGDRWWSAYVRQNLGACASRHGDHQRAQALLEDSVQRFQQLGDPWGSVWALDALAWELARPGADDGAERRRRAMALQEASLVQVRQTGDLFATACVLGSLGRLVAEQGDDRRAHALLAESLRLNHALGTYAGSGGGALLDLAALLVHRGQHEQLERAARLYGAAEAYSSVIGTDGLREEERAVYQRAVAQLQRQLGARTFATAWARGRTLSLEEAIAEALEAATEDAP